MEISHSVDDAPLGVDVEEVQLVELDGDLHLLGQLRPMARVDLEDEGIVAAARVYHRLVPRDVDHVDGEPQDRARAARSAVALQDSLRPEANDYILAGSRYERLVRSCRRRYGEALGREEPPGLGHGGANEGHRRRADEPRDEEVLGMLVELGRRPDLL